MARSLPNSEDITMKQRQNQGGAYVELFFLFGGGKGRAGGRSHGSGTDVSGGEGPLLVEQYD